MIGRRSGIAAAGSWIVDRVKRIDAYPREDTLANILDERVGNGGCAYNVLVDLARLGAVFPLRAIGLLGEDGDGAAIRLDCRTHGIDTRGLGTATGSTSYTDVMTVSSTGRRTFFHQRGVNALLDIDHVLAHIGDSRILHLGYLLLLDRLDEPHPTAGTRAAEALRCAQEAGVATCIDVVSEDSQRFARIVAPALRYCDYCIVNEFEAERTTGITLRDGDGPAWDRLPLACQALLEHGVRSWAVIHFPEGAVARSARGEVVVQRSVAMPSDRIAGSVGAGDAFAAALLHGLHEDLPMVTCLQDACSVAAASLTVATASDGVLSLAECRRLAQGLGFRS